MDNPVIRYSGVKANGGAGDQRIYRQVLPDGEVKRLYPDLSLSVYNHSPDGFNWGYGGSGPAQTALALLLDVTRDPDMSVRHHQTFKSQFVAGWGDQWEITSADILAFLEINELEYANRNHSNN